ncbi:hypothetical protein PEBR_16904 [Penicillium brasilianum]|uniref:Uncharacterized protein n=1 Tax=Penicillium brasilianum TaxID=104259 RepID=A0A1S9RVA7_PENBI|nr:hypothetical protein PEBR_16904 [Penicillium brasilianum]
MITSFLCYPSELVPGQRGEKVRGKEVVIPLDITVANPSTKANPRFKASSKYLVLSSPYFMNRREPNRPEGRRMALDGVLEIKANGFVFQTLLIILNIIHLRNDRLPKMAPGLLLKIAIITAYYYRVPPLQPGRGVI